MRSERGNAQGDQAPPLERTCRTNKSVGQVHRVWWGNVGLLVCVGERIGVELRVCVPSFAELTVP